MTIDVKYEVIMRKINLFLILIAFLLSQLTYARTLEEYHDDYTIYRNVNLILNKYSALADVFVHVYKGNVIACGLLNENEVRQADRFLTDIEKIKGVQVVYNHFKIKYKDPTQVRAVKNKMEDDLATLAVRKSLFLTNDIPAHNLTVLADEKNIYVCGFVPSTESADEVQRILDDVQKKFTLMNYHAVLVPIA